MLRDFLLNLPRRHKRVLQVATDLLLIWLCLWLAFVVRVGFDRAWVAVNEHTWLFFIAPLITIPLCIRFGMYRAVMRYLGREALVEIAKALTVAALVLSAVILWLQRPDEPQIPRSFIMLYWTISLLAVMEPVAFLDDDDSIATRSIAGLKVYKPKHIEEMLRVTGASQVLLAMPSATRARRREVLALLEPYPVHVRSVPGFMDLAQGLVKVQDLQEVDIADLLGRDAVVPNPVARSVPSCVARFWPVAQPR